MPKTVLVVDDSSTIREAVRLAVTGEPWSVVAASNEEEALAALGEASPDVVLCDVDLPGGDGYELCRKLRGRPEGARVPVVLMGSRVPPAAASSAGAIATLAKPFSSEELLGALQEAVEMQSFGMDDLELDLTSDPQKAEPEAAAGPAEEEVEIIDLSDEDDLSEFELLEDLEPIEVPQPPEEGEPALGLDDLLSFDTDTVGGGETSGELDLGPAAEAGGADDEIGDLLASLSEEPVEEKPAAEPEDEIGDLLADLAEEPAEGLQAAPTKEASAESEVEPQEPAGALFQGLGGEDLRAEAEEEPAEPGEPPETEGIEPAPAMETPEDYEAAAAQWAEPGPTPPHEASWDVEPPAAVSGADLAPAVESAVRSALEQSLSAEALTPLVQATVEKVVWEVVPQLAERLIQEAIEKIKQEPEGAA